MPESAKDAWQEVGDRFSEWGRMAADHYKKRGEEYGEPTEEDRRKLEEAVQAVTKQLDQAFTSFGDTLRDPQAKEGLKKAVRSVGEALSITFAEAGSEVRKRFGSNAGEG